MPIQATPFAPGRATGRLQTSPGACTPDTIALLGFDQLGQLAGRPRGLILVDPPRLAHAVTRLLGEGIPVVIIDNDQREQLAPGAETLIDGESGCIDQPPPPETRSTAAAPRPPRPGRPVASLDHQAIHLRCSISTAEAAARARESGAQAIGLVRSEFLVPPANRVPDRAFYTRALKRLLEAASPLAVTVRLLDLAPDKRPAWAADTPASAGPLGLQGCRLFGREPVASAFQNEVTALDALAADFPLSILVPFVTAPAEFRHWQSEIRDRMTRPIPVGVMVESPAAALHMDHWVEAADHVALGCNDLMQSLFAADREQPELSALLDPFSPVLFRFLDQVAALAGERVGQIQLCGLLPQVPGVLPVLIGIGYRSFSVEPSLVPHLARRVRETDTQATRELVRAVCNCRDAEEVREVLE